RPRFQPVSARAQSLHHFAVVVGRELTLDVRLEAEAAPEVGGIRHDLNLIGRPVGPASRQLAESVALQRPMPTPRSLRGTVTSRLPPPHRSARAVNEPVTGAAPVSSRFPSRPRYPAISTESSHRAASAAAGGALAAWSGCRIG